MWATNDDPGAWFVVLGGKNPGVKDAEPFMVGSKYTFPLPISVKCDTCNQADDVNRFNELLKPLKKLNPDSCTMLNLMANSPLMAEILPDIDEYYCVVHGSSSGIYLH
ncbi:hypothetical protein SCP_0410320 [Sparassis crispa]|uniref:Uncharacterized protein n=1 Tax=Sparassis crispa TaxID=139825 RepID=A0A401GKE9_9APHY|nr:hypothetical protein SCP_0410320 [Sparassis crispa]GBE82647.1 hypothetical protein SCP_0410320 [Sparassis crispa]